MSDSKFCGAYLNPTTDTVKYYVDVFKSKVEGVDKKKHPIEYHNIYVLYTCLLLMFSTTHRPVRDPFARRCHISTDAGLAQISDKVVTDLHEWRLVALPNIAVEAVNEYDEHLCGLAQVMSGNSATRILGKELLNLITNDNPNIPYLFLIGNDYQTYSITRTKIEEFFPKHFSLPANFYRHVFSTYMSLLEIKSEIVELQMGHMHGSSHSFGPSESLSPIQFSKLLCPSIDGWMHGLGWVVFPGIKEEHSGWRVSLLKDKSRVEVHENSSFGPELRYAARAEKKAVDKSVVRQAFSEIIPPSGANKITAENGRNIQLRIIDLSTNDNAVQSNRRIRLFWRLLPALKRRNWDIQFPVRLMQLVAEKSPFSSKTIEYYQIGLELRQKFISYLNNKTACSKVSVERRVAEIIISAVVFGNVVNNKSIEGLPAALKERTFSFDKRYLVEILYVVKNKKSKSERWISDKISTGLISGFRRHFSEGASFTDKAISAEVRVLINELIPGLLIRKKPIYVLSKIGKELVAIELTPLQSMYRKGAISSKSLSFSTLLRVIEDKRLCMNMSVPDGGSDIEEEIIGGAQEISDQSEIDSVLFIKRINSLFNKVERQPVKGANRSSNVQKKYLEKLIVEMVGDEAKSLSPICKAVASWALNLCKRGTRNKKNLKYTTITGYVRTVSRILCRTAFKEHFFELTADEYEDVYIRALDLTTDKSRAYAGKRIYEFHCFLVRAADVREDISWSGILPDGEHVVDANIITNIEYGRVLDVLENTNEVDEHMRKIMIGLTIVGFRFGLRVGEAERLQGNDIQFGEDGSIIVLVRNNIYGSVKRDASIRQIALVGGIEGREIKILNELISYAKERQRQDAQVGLFSFRKDAREIIPRSYIYGVVHQVLRYVTGDVTIKFQHLRHSYANRIYIAMNYMKFTDNALGALIADRILGAYEPELNDCIGCSSPNRALSSFIGHRSITTTAENYLHILEWCCDSFYENVFSEALTDKAIAYILQVASSYPRVQRHRLSAAGVNSKDVLNLKTMSPEINSINILRRSPSQVEDFELVNKISTEKISFYDVEQILNDLSAGKIGLNHILKKSLISSALVSAAHCEARIGSPLYGFICDVNDCFWPPEPIHRNELKLHQYSKVIRVLLEKAWGSYNKLSEEKKSSTSAGINTIIGMYETGSNYLVVGNMHELKTLTDTLVNLGVSVDDLRAKVPRDLNEEKKKQLETILVDIGIKKSSDAWVPYIGNNINPLRQQRIMIRPRQGGGLHNDKIFRKFLIVVYTYSHIAIS